MKKGNYIVGLDIGTTKIAVVIGRKDKFGKCEIIDVCKTDSVGVNKGKAINLLDTSESIKRVIEIAKDKTGVDITEVFVGIASQHIGSMQTQGELLRKNTDDTVTKQEVDDFVESMYKVNNKPGETVISVMPQEFIIDDDIVVSKAVGMMANKVKGMFHVIVCNAQSVLSIEKCVNMCNLSVSDVVLEPIASSTSVLSDDEKEAGVALVDIGGGTTDLAIFYDGVIRHTAVIPLGGEIITDDIRQGCGLIKKYAEQLKIQHGSAWALQEYESTIITIPGLKGGQKKEISKFNLTNIIQARMVDIIDLVNQHIKSSGFGDRLGGGIVLTGGGALLNDVATLVKFKTGYDARIGTPDEHLSYSQPMKETVCSPIYSTSIGLVLEGFKIVGKSDIDNIEEEVDELEEVDVLIDNPIETIEEIEDDFLETEIEEDDQEEEEVDDYTSYVSTRKTFLDRIKDFFSTEEIK